MGRGEGGEGREKTSPLPYPGWMRWVIWLLLCSVIGPDGNGVWGG